MKKGRFVEIISMDIIAMLLFVVPVLMSHNEPDTAMRAAMYTYIYAGPVITAMVGTVCGIVKRVPVITSIFTLMIGLTTAYFINTMWFLSFIPAVAIYLGYFIGWIIHQLVEK